MANFPLIELLLWINSILVTPWIIVRSLRLVYGLGIAHKMDGVASFFHSLVGGDLP